METKLLQNITKKLFNSFPEYNSEFDIDFPDISSIFYEFTTKYIVNNINNEAVLNEFIKFLEYLQSRNNSYLIFIMIDSIFYPIYDNDEQFFKILKKMRSPLKELFMSKKQEKIYAYYI